MALRWPFFNEMELGWFASLRVFAGFMRFVLIALGARFLYRARIVSHKRVTRRLTAWVQMRIIRLLWCCAKKECQETLIGEVCAYNVGHG